MRGKVWVLLGAASVIFIILAGQSGPHAKAQVSRTQVPLFEPDPLWSQVLPNK